MENNVDGFIESLVQDNKYHSENIRKNTYRYDGKTYDRVEVIMGEYVIQAFVLMDDDQCKEKDKFPFYRSYYFQRNDYGYVIPPACNVAVYNTTTKHWDIHGSVDLKLELTSPDFLNYDFAVDRFNKRLYFPGSGKVWKRIIRRAWLSLIIVSMYVVAYILSSNGLLCGFDVPMNASVIGAFIIIVALLLLPPLMPYIKSISIKGCGIEFYEALLNRQ